MAPAGGPLQRTKVFWFFFSKKNVFLLPDGRVTRPAWSLDIGQTQAGFAAGSLTPGDVQESIIERTTAVNPRINAFACLDIDGARAAARASTARWHGGTPLGPFDGITLTIKDNITVAGLPCAWGSELFRDFVPARDELPVARLRAQGAVLLGKTNVSEFTVAQTTVSTSAFGTTRNPWNLAKTTGASSGGAAAAVASGLGAVALGTDGGGSIRRPACHCGLVGLKPSTGRVARRDGLPIILHDCEVIGPLARSVDSLARIFQIIGQPDQRDRASLAFAPLPTTPDLPPPKRLTILYVPRFDWHPVDDEVAASCAQAARNLAALGHQVTTASAPFDPTLFERHWPTVSEAGLAWLLRDRPWRGKISALHAAMVERGAALPATDYVAALTAFRDLQAQLFRLFETCDLLMTPTAGALPWPAEQQGPPHNRVFTGFVNGAGLPAVSIPCDPATDGLPIGFQLVGRFGADWDLLRVAAEYERAHPWASRWPAL